MSDESKTVNPKPKEETMPKDPHQERVVRKCAAALSKAIDAFPDLLARSDPQVAAVIVASLIKASLKHSDSEVGEEESLTDLIQRLAEEEKRERLSDSEQEFYLVI
ncbi:MAG: hypothetical protein Q7N50_16305 [Armatimonadota bacterium]|nr:hypothetical protein [Armatimonadota bacterium]